MTGPIVFWGGKGTLKLSTCFESKKLPGRSAATKVKGTTIEVFFGGDRHGWWYFKSQIVGMIGIYETDPENCPWCTWLTCETLLMSITLLNYKRATEFIRNWSLPDTWWSTTKRETLVQLLNQTAEWWTIHILEIKRQVVGPLTARSEIWGLTSLIATFTYRFCFCPI